MSKKMYKTKLVELPSVSGIVSIISSVDSKLCSVCSIDNRPYLVVFAEEIDEGDPTKSYHLLLQRSETTITFPETLDGSPYSVVNQIKYIGSPPVISEDKQKISILHVYHIESPRLLTTIHQEGKDVIGIN